MKGHGLAEGPQEPSTAFATTQRASSKGPKGPRHPQLGFRLLDCKSPHSPYFTLDVADTHPPAAQRKFAESEEPINQPTDTYRVSTTCQMLQPP